MEVSIEELCTGDPRCFPFIRATHVDQTKGRRTFELLFERLNTERSHFGGLPGVLHLEGGSVGCVDVIDDESVRSRSGQTVHGDLETVYFADHRGFWKRTDTEPVVVVAADFEKDDFRGITQ